MSGPSVTFEVVATDAAGNATTATVAIRVDRNAPLVVITLPAPGVVPPTVLAVEPLVMKTPDPFAIAAVPAGFVPR